MRFGVDGVLVLAVLARESFGGDFLKPKGPAGTGDWAPRPWAWYEARPDAKQRFMRYEDGDGKVMCLPIDNLGWGRGLMQLDWAEERFYGFFEKLMEDGSAAWRNAAENIYAGAELLAELVGVFDHDERLAACAYNAGRVKVKRALLALSSPSSDERRWRAADAVTTGKNYGGDVMKRRANFRRLLLSTQP